MIAAIDPAVEPWMIVVTLDDGREGYFDANGEFITIGVEDVERLEGPEFMRVGNKQVQERLLDDEVLVNGYLTKRSAVRETVVLDTIVQAQRVEGGEEEYWGLTPHSAIKLPMQVMLTPRLLRQLAAMVEVAE